MDVEPWGQHHGDRDDGRRKQAGPHRVVSLELRQKVMVSGMNSPELR